MSIANMVDGPSIDELRAALAPMEALRGEELELESWIAESLAATEALHAELAEWHVELARQQADLDKQRAAFGATAKQQSAAAGQANDAARNALERELADLAEQLQLAHSDARQLEGENAEQLQALDELNRQFVAAQAELRATRRHCEELSVALETERHRSSDDHRNWAGELRDMRLLLERHGDMLAALTGAGEADTIAVKIAEPCTDDASARDFEGDDACDLASRTADLLRRGASRRGAQRRSG